MTTEHSSARRLRDAVEPIAANVYFAPEAHQAYAELGLAGFGPGYFCSRGACLGQVPGEVIAAAFGVFNPAMVKVQVDQGWAATDAATILDARERGAVAGLERILGPVTPAGDIARATELLQRAADAAPAEGHMLYSGLRSLGWPGTPFGDLWRAADLVREHRGDSHVAAIVAHGLHPIDVLALTEAWWGIPVNSYLRTRAWPHDDVEVRIAALRERGLLDGDSLTDEGRAIRLALEETTDRAEQPLVDALGDDAAELCELLEPWSRAIVAAGGYPTDPSQLAATARRAAS